MKRLALSLLLTAAVAGCASVPMGDPTADARAKTFQAPEQMAGLYIYRNETFGMTNRFRVLVDGQIVGETGAQTYLYRELPPGNYRISSMGGGNEDSLEVDLKPGTLTYVWQEVKMGMFAAGTKLQRVPEEQGRAGVLESKLIQTWQPTPGR